MLHLPWQTCCVFAASKELKPSTLHPFDSDSFQIKIYNCASKCIINCIEDFKSPPDPISLNIIGVGGNIPCTHIGTVNWVIDDDQGHKHRFNIPGTIYAPLAFNHRNIGAKQQMTIYSIPMAPGAAPMLIMYNYIGPNANSPALSH
jgi:hypothetical protein